MKISTSVRIELLKLNHTGFWFLQLLIILGSMLVLNGYYILYAFEEAMPRIKIIYEFVGILTPIISSIFVAFLVRIDEQASNMYGILAARHRKKLAMGMLLISWSITVLQLFGQIVSLLLLGRGENAVVSKILLLGSGTMIFSLFFYVFHLFLHLRFGIGISMLWGVFECMQAVMYSNIQLAGVFCYIPSAWLMEWKACILAGELKEKAEFWVTCLLMLSLYLALFLFWFERWEGRKRHEE